MKSAQTVQRFGRLLAFVVGACSGLVLGQLVVRAARGTVGLDAVPSAVLGALAFSAWTFVLLRLTVVGDEAHHGAHPLVKLGVLTWIWGAAQIPILYWLRDGVASYQLAWLLPMIVGSTLVCLRLCRVWISDIEGRSASGRPALLSSEAASLEQVALRGPSRQLDPRVDVPRRQTVPRMPASVSLVIPARNEAGSLGWVLERVPNYVTEVILVDGQSVDDTVALACGLRPDIVVVNEERPGKGAALRTGFAAAGGDFIVMLDGDGSMDPHEIDRFVRLLTVGYDFVKGSRFVDGGGSKDITTARRVGNRALLTLANLLYGSSFTDLCYGFCALKRCHLEALALTARGFEIEAQMALRALKANLRIAETPSFEHARRSGRSNLRPFRDGRRVLMTLLRERMIRRIPRAAGRTEVAEAVPDAEIVATAPHETALRPDLSLEAGG